MIAPCSNLKNHVWLPWNNFFQEFTVSTWDSIWVIVHWQPPSCSLRSAQGWCQQWRHSLAQDGLDKTFPRHPKCSLTPPALSSAVLGLIQLCSQPPAFRCHLGIPLFCINLLVLQWGGPVTKRWWSRTFYTIIPTINPVLQTIWYSFIYRSMCHMPKIITAEFSAS